MSNEIWMDELAQQCVKKDASHLGDFQNAAGYRDAENILCLRIEIDRELDQGIDYRRVAALADRLGAEEVNTNDFDTVKRREYQGDYGSMEVTWANLIVHIVFWHCENLDKEFPDVDDWNFATTIKERQEWDADREAEAYAQMAQEEFGQKTQSE